MTKPLVTLIEAQDQTSLVDLFETTEIKKEIHSSNQRKQENGAKSIYSNLSPQLKRSVDLVKIMDLLHGFQFYLLMIRGSTSIKGISVMPCVLGTPGHYQTHLCNCGKSFSTDHAMICHMRQDLRKGHNWRKYHYIELSKIKTKK